MAAVLSGPDEEALMSTDPELATAIPATGRSFRPGLDAPGQARWFARDFLVGAGAGERCQQVGELLVSELVTNAIMHARSTARLSVSVLGGTARIEVSDDGPGQPHLRAQPGEDGGYGLWLVDWLAQAWGIDTSGGGLGKTLWFTLPLSAAPQA